MENIIENQKDEKKVIDNQKKVVQALWLHYFNRYLFEQGIISEEKRNIMANKIDSFSS